MSDRGTHEHISFLKPEQRTGYPEIMPPPEGLTGELLLAQAELLINQDHRLTDAERQHVRDQLAELINATVLNAPILFLSSDLAGGEIKKAGYVGTGLGLVRNSNGVDGDWQLSVQMFSEDFRGDWQGAYVQYSAWSFVGDAAHGHSRLLVGEPAVSEWLGRRSLAVVNVAEPTAFHLHNDLLLLHTIRQARMPLDYFGLTDDQRQDMSGHIAEVLMGGGGRAVRMGGLLDMLEYVTGATAQEQKDQLHHELLAEVIPLLPVSHVNGHPRAVDLAVEIGRRLSQLEGLPSGVELGEKTRIVATLAMMYRRRSLVADEAEPPAINTVTLAQGPWADEHVLRTFEHNSPTETEIWDDIAYLVHLKNTGVPLETIKPTELRMRKIIGTLQDYMMRDAQPDEFPPVLDSLEYLFEAQTDADRRRFYAKFLLYAIARKAPIVHRNETTVKRFVTVTAAVARHAPASLFGYRDQEMRGDAATAALLADMYEWWVRGYRKRDMAKQGLEDSLGEQAETAA